MEGTLFPKKIPTVTVRQDPIYEYLPRRGLDSDTYGRLKFTWMTPRPPMNMFLPRMSMQIVGAFFWGDVYIDEHSTCEAPNVPLVKLLLLHWFCKFL